MSTFAGNSVPGSSGDGGTPTSAKLNGQQGVGVLGRGGGVGFEGQQGVVAEHAGCVVGDLD
jgi:hypothetical protein